MIFLHNCTHLQRYPFLLFQVVWDLTANGSNAMFFLFFMRLVSLGQYRIVSDGVWTVLKVTPFSPVLPVLHQSRLKPAEMMCGVYLPQTLFNCSSPQCLRFLRGATQTECCNISYHGNNLFLWAGGRVSIPSVWFGCLEHLTRLAGRH